MKNCFWDWRDESAVKNTYCSHRGSSVLSIHVGKLTAYKSSLGDLSPSSNSFSSHLPVCAHMSVHAHTEIKTYIMF